MGLPTTQTHFKEILIISISQFQKVSARTNHVSAFMCAHEYISIITKIGRYAY